LTSYKSVYQGQPQNADYQVQVPVVAAGYNSPVTFTATIDPPTAGVNVTFPNGNVVSNFPGTVNLNVSSTASVPAGEYRIIVTGTGNGKTHSTSVGYLVGKNYILTGTNRQINNLSYMIDNVNYTATHSFTWDLNSTHTLSAVSPQTIASIDRKSVV